MEFIFETFDEAMQVHKHLFELRRKKGYVTCADLYSMVMKDEVEKIEICSKEIYHNHGWTNLFEVEVEPSDKYINGKWILKLPKAKILKNLIKKEKE